MNEKWQIIMSGNEMLKYWIRIEEIGQKSRKYPYTHIYKIKRSVNIVIYDKYPKLPDRVVPKMEKENKRNH